MDENADGCPSICLERLTPMCKNEISICDRILSSGVERNRFSIVMSVEKAHIAQIDKESTELATDGTGTGEIPLVLITRSNYSLEPLSDYLTACSSKHTFVVVLLTVSLHIFKSIMELDAIGVAHGSLTVETIGVTQNGNLPIVGDFSRAIRSRGASFEAVPDFVHEDEEAAFCWPPERHLARAVRRRGGDAVSEDDVRAALNSFTDTATVLLLYTEEFRSHYEYVIGETLGRWVGTGARDFMSSVSRFVPTWDVYSLSVSMLGLVGYGFTQSKYCNRPMIAYAQFLTSNIHPDPERRPSASEAAGTLNAILTGV